MEPDSAPFLFVVASGVVRRSGRRVSWVPDIITDARAAIFRAMAADRTTRHPIEHTAVVH